MAQAIHWFPGHMKKALNEMQDKIKLVDVIIELFDARIPNSSFNEEFEKLINNKKRIYVLTKIDLADPKVTDLWINKFKAEGYPFLAINTTSGDFVKKLSCVMSDLCKEKHQKEISKGMKPQPIRAMIIGIPNVGKSSLINKLSKRKVAGVENRPGFTRGEQLIKINNDFMLLDTPGVLPMNYDNKHKAINLALTGAIKEEILPTLDLAKYLISYLNENYPDALKERFEIDDLSDYQFVLNGIASRRGISDQNETLRLEKASNLLLYEFKNGKLGRISLEK